MNCCDIILVRLILMKCIFLDFDGVINNWHHFDEVSIENAIILKKIVDISDAKIIATTSNKYSLQRFDKVDYHSSNFYYNYVKFLNELGIQIYDLTPLVNANRTLEIQKYLQEHDVEQYVILDDELIGEELQEHQVFLDLYRGLQEEHIIPALNILNGNLGFYPPNYDRNETPEELNRRINSYYSKTRK